MIAWEPALQTGGSVLGESREGLGGVAVPPEALDGVAPPRLHVRARRLVRRVAGPNGILEMTVLRLDDLVRGRSAQLQVAGAAELAAGHRLHLELLGSGCEGPNSEVRSGEDEGVTPYRLRSVERPGR